MVSKKIINIGGYDIIYSWKDENIKREITEVDQEYIQEKLEDGFQCWEISSLQYNSNEDDDWMEYNGWWEIEDVNNIS